jgi:hypothetical protein
MAMMFPPTADTLTNSRAPVPLPLIWIIKSSSPVENPSLELTLMVPFPEGALVERVVLTVSTTMAPMTVRFPSLPLPVPMSQPGRAEPFSTVILNISLIPPVALGSSKESLQQPAPLEGSADAGPAISTSAGKPPTRTSNPKKSDKARRRPTTRFIRL